MIEDLNRYSTLPRGWIDDPTGKGRKAEETRKMLVNEHQYEAEVDRRLAAMTSQPKTDNSGKDANGIDVWNGVVSSLNSGGSYS